MEGFWGELGLRVWGSVLKLWSFVDFVLRGWESRAFALGLGLGFKGAQAGTQAHRRCLREAHAATTCRWKACAHSNLETDPWCSRSVSGSLFVNAYIRRIYAQRAHANQPTLTQGDEHAHTLATIRPKDNMYACTYARGRTGTRTRARAHQHHLPALDDDEEETTTTTTIDDHCDYNQNCDNGFSFVWETSSAMTTTINVSTGVSIRSLHPVYSRASFSTQYLCVHHQQVLSH